MAGVIISFGQLCTPVGVTWVFGFLTQSVTGMLVFSYIYILLKYLQGGFIFVAFCLNKRVRDLWREKVRKRRRLSKKGKAWDVNDQPKESAAITSTVHESTEESRL